MVFSYDEVCKIMEKLENDPFSILLDELNNIYDPKEKIYDDIYVIKLLNKLENHEDKLSKDEKDKIVFIKLTYGLTNDSDGGLSYDDKKTTEILPEPEPLGKPESIKLNLNENNIKKINEIDEKIIKINNFSGYGLKTIGYVGDLTKDRLILQRLKLIKSQFKPLDNNNDVNFNDNKQTIKSIDIILNFLKEKLLNMQEFVKNNIINDLKKEGYIPPKEETEKREFDELINKYVNDINNNKNFDELIKEVQNIYSKRRRRRSFKRKKRKNKRKEEDNNNGEKTPPAAPAPGGQPPASTGPGRGQPPGGGPGQGQPAAPPPAPPAAQGGRPPAAARPPGGRGRRSERHYNIDGGGGRTTIIIFR